MALAISVGNLWYSQVKPPNVIVRSGDLSFVPFAADPSNGAQRSLALGLRFFLHNAGARAGVVEDFSVVVVGPSTRPSTQVLHPSVAFDLQALVEARTSGRPDVTALRGPHSPLVLSGRQSTSVEYLFGPVDGSSFALQAGEYQFQAFCLSEGGEYKMFREYRMEIPPSQLVTLAGGEIAVRAIGERRTEFARRFRS